MVMSVKELMTGLANSVRLKTGKTGKMTLEQITDAIIGITVEGDVGFKCGTFTASSTGTSRTINHDLGQIPGAIIFTKMGTTAGTAGSVGSYVRDALVSIVYGEGVGHSYCYHYSSRTSSSASPSNSRTWSHSATTPTNMFGSGSTSSYYVTNINETSFKTPSYLISGKKYFWIAFRAPLA